MQSVKDEGTRRICLLDDNHTSDTGYPVICAFSDFLGLVFSVIIILILFTLRAKTNPS